MHAINLVLLKPAWKAIPGLSRWYAQLPCTLLAALPTRKAWPGLVPRITGTRVGWLLRKEAETSLQPDCFFA